MPRRRTRPFLAPLAALILTVGLVATGCGGGSSNSLGKRPTTTPAATTAAAPSLSYIATARSTVTKVAIYDRPGATTPTRELNNPWLVDPSVPTSTVTQVFLVKQQRPDGWVQVLLPVRPNGSTGWLRAADVTITPTLFKIVVKLDAHMITVMNGKQVIYEGPVAVGATNPPLPDVGKPTPTPTGEYYLRVLIQAPDPTTVYGPYAYGLSSHSDALDTFEGGDAEIGIHGNNDASVLGKSVTHGCIRMDNAAITKLSRMLPLGTPVQVLA